MIRVVITAIFMQCLTPVWAQDAEIDDELSLGAEEIRREYHWGVAAGVGVTDMWQKLGGGFYYVWSDSVVASLEYGWGEAHFEGQRTSVKYEIETMARSVSFGSRLFFASFTPLYVHAGLGMASFSGDVNPINADESDPDIAAKLRASFAASGPFLSLKLGWAKVWDSGFYLDYTLLGFGKQFLTETNFTRASSEARSVVTEEIEEPTSWGLINLRLGWFF